MLHNISLIYPAWNEEKYVEKAILKANKALKDITNNYEIILVDDGSTDRTREIAEKLAKKNSHLRVLHHKTNQKLGKAIRTGIFAAQKDLILYSDIDLPFDFKKIKEMISLMESTNADIVSGFRFNRVEKELRRAIYTFTYNLLIKILFKINIKDINCPAKLFKKSIFEKIELKSNGSFIDAELIVKSIKKGYKVSQIELEYFPRTESKSRASNITVVLGVLREMVLLYKETMSKD